MASPLLEYANSYLRVVSEGGVQRVNGRMTVTPGPVYIVKCYIKRIQYTGVTSGSRKLPLESQLEGRMLPGAAGDQFFYRGYALQRAAIDESLVNWLDDSDLAGVSFGNVTQQESFLLPGEEVDFRFGDDPVMKGTIERSSGQFGGEGIDQILYPALGGVEIQIKGANVQN